MTIVLVLVGFFILYMMIKSQLDAFDLRLKRLEQAQTQPASAPTSAPAAAAPAASSLATPAMSTSLAGGPASAPPMSAPGHSVIDWIKEDFLVKMGAFLLLLAFGWFVSYAFANNWIGPIGRITLGLLAGVGVLTLAAWRIKTHLHQGGIFAVLGSAIILLTTFAAREIYEFFTPVSALLLMFLSVCFVSFLAVQYRSQTLALTGLGLGVIAPFFTNSEPNALSLFLYALVLVVGSLWVQRWIGAVVMPVAAFMAVALYTTPYLLGAGSGVDDSIALLFAFIFTAIFFVSNVQSILTCTDETARQAQAVLAFGTALFLAVWITVAADPMWHSLLYVLWALVFSIGAYLVFIRTNERAPFYIYGATGLGLIAAATAVELSGAWLTVAYVFEITLLMAGLSLLTNSHTLVSRLSYLFIGPVILSVEHLVSSAWETGFWHSDFAALVVLVGGLIAAARLVIETRDTEEKTEDTALILVSASAIYIIIMVWLVIHSVLVAALATPLALLVYTVSGLIAYVIGRTTGNRAVRIGGSLLLGLVIIRLLLVEVWMMELVGRIITFFVIGVLLVSTAFIRQRQHD